MKYIVEVHEPVPDDLDEVAGKVANAFHITDDKARTLLRRAPGPVTRPVNEREARLVAEIFERAGLRVVTLPYEPVPEAEPELAPEPEPEPGLGSASGEPSGAAEAPAPGPDAIPVGGGPGDAGAEDREFGEAGPAAPWESEADREADRANDLEEAAYADADRGSEAGGPGATEGDGWDRPAGKDVDVAGEDASGEDLAGEDLTVEEVGGGAGEALAAEVGHMDAALGEPASGYGASEDADYGGAVPEGDRPAYGAVADGGAMYEGSAYGASVAAAPAIGATEEGAIEAEDVARQDAMAGEVAGADVPAGPMAEAALAGAAAAAAGGDVGSAPSPESLRRSHTAETARRSAVPEMGVRTLSGSGATLARGGLRRSVAMSATLPTVLTALVMLVAVVVTVLPVLRHQRAGAAAAVASSFAASIEGLDGGLPLTSPIVQAMLGDVARRAQAPLTERGVAFMAVTDASGIPLVSWSASGVNALPPELSSVVNDAALRASEAAVTPTEGWSQSLSRSLDTVRALLGFGDEAPVVAAAPMRGGGATLGAVVVGVRPNAADGALGSALITTLLVGLVPVLIAILVALSLTRGLTAAVSYLLEAADRISRGDLDHPVELPRNDELGQLARSIERMRVSLQEGLERLRRRR